MSTDASLAAGLAELGLPLREEACRQLADYLRLLQKWNRVYSLTAVRGEREMLTHHLLDSLAVVPHLRGTTIVDVGSGAGLPGIPLAVALPQARVALIDSNHKKATFLRQAVIELGLSNVDVLCERVESWRPATPYDVVVSRAFSELGEFLALAGHLCAGDGMIVAMKGVHPYEELERLPAGYRVSEVRRIRVPGLDADRHLVLVQPQAALQAED